MKRDMERQANTSHVADEIRRTLDTLSKTERRVARALLSNYPAAGLETATRLAERSGASAPTVTRYVTKLGFADYRQFQQAVRDEVEARRMGPMHAPSQFGPNTPASRLLSESSRTASDLISGAFDHIPPGEFSRAIQLMADPKNRLHGVGGRFSKVLASFWELHLRMLRGGCNVLEMTPEGSAAHLIDAGRRDVFVVFDFRRYQTASMDFARLIQARKSKLILVTDLWLSPIAEIADVVIPLQTENGSPFDSLVPAAVLVETMAAGLLADLGDDAYGRMRMIDGLVGGV